MNGSNTASSYDGGVGRGAKAFTLLVMLFFIFFLLASSSLSKVNLADNGTGVSAASAQSGTFQQSVSQSTSTQPQVITIQDNPSTSQGQNILPVTGSCTNPYTVQPGDSLSQIAVFCNTSVAEIRQINPEITNVNMIYPGQQLRIPGIGDNQQPIPAPVTGGSDGSFLLPTATPAGAQVAPVIPSMVGGFPVIPTGKGLQVRGLNFPPNTPVNIAVGPKNAGYNIISAAITDASGTIVSRITIPAVADSNTLYVVVVATASTPVVQAFSLPFYIVPSSGTGSTNP